MKKNVIFALAKKEFFSYINSVLAYVIIVPFLLLSMFIYLRTSIVYGEASLRPYFELLPWYLLVLAPALSMKLLTDEQRQGTIELLFGHPISELEIVVAKFLGVFAFFIVMMATTLLLPLSLVYFAKPDIGVILAQYIGSLFVGATFLSIGLAASAYVKNAIGSFLLSLAISFALIIIGLDFVTLLLPWPGNQIVSELAILPHMENIARGLLDFRDIIYFLTITGVFLLITVLKLAERKTKEDKKESRKLRLALAIVVGIGIVTNVLVTFYPVRLDLTQQRLFSLSVGTKQTLATLPDIVTITIFASHNLPAPMQVVFKQLQDTMGDYQRFGKNIRLRILYPDTDGGATQEAASAGIREVTFNRIGSGKFEVQSGYLGLSIRYADKVEALPFIQDTTDLEYQLTRRIRKLTQKNETTIGLLRNSAKSYQILEQTLATQYTIKSISPEETKIVDVAALLVIDDGSKKSSPSATVKQYLENNGKVLVMTDGVSVNAQYLSAGATQSELTDFIKDYGIQRNQDLVYDLELNETLSFGQQQVRYLVPYPFWLIALPKDEGFIGLAGIKRMTLAWPSSLTISKKEGIVYKELLSTSRASGRQEKTFTISPTDLKNLPGPLNQPILLSALAEKGNMKLAVVGDADFATDDFLQNSPENLAFVSNMVDYLLAAKDVAAIPNKTSGRAVFQFNNPFELIAFQYGNILLPPLVVIAFAVFWLGRRRRLAQRIYENSNA